MIWKSLAIPYGLGTTAARARSEAMDGIQFPYTGGNGVYSISTPIPEGYVDGDITVRLIMHYGYLGTAGQAVRWLVSHGWPHVGVAFQDPGSFTDVGVTVNMESIPAYAPHVVDFTIPAAAVHTDAEFLALKITRDISVAGNLQRNVYCVGIKLGYNGLGL
jgi:hypothetical protein